MRGTQLITTAAVVAACAVPATAAGQGQDLRSPDARDAAAAGGYMYSSDAASAEARVQGHAPATTQVAQDLRSPDARDARTEPVTQVAQDLRSPDARDAGRLPAQVATPVVEVRDAAGSGFDWGDAGIGAGSVLALVLIGAGASVAVSHRRHHGPSPLVG